MLLICQSTTQKGIQYFDEKRMNQTNSTEVKKKEGKLIWKA